MHIIPFRGSETTCYTVNGKDNEPAYRTCYKSACYEVYILSDTECRFSKIYEFESGESLMTADHHTINCTLPPIAKERKVPMAYLDFLCTLVDSMGVKDLCRRIKESDDTETRILLPEEFQVIIKHKRVEIFYLFNRLNFKALHDKQVIQEIKSILYDIDLFFNTVFDMSDDELVKNEASVSKLVADYWGEAD